MKTENSRRVTESRPVYVGLYGDANRSRYASSLVIVLSSVNIEEVLAILPTKIFNSIDSSKTLLFMYCCYIEFGGSSTAIFFVP